MPEIATRAGDYARFQQQNINRINTGKALDTTQGQLTSGQKSLAYSDDPNNLTEVFNIKTELNKITQYKNNINKVDGRLEVAETSLNTILGIMQEFRSNLARIVQPGNKDDAFQAFCNNCLQGMADALNAVDSEKNNVFGGTMWQGTVVDLSALPTPGLGSNPTTAYYKGDQGQNIVHINDNNNMDYTFRADDPAIAEVFYALKIGATTTPDYDESGPNMQKLRQALNAINQATEDVPAMLARVGTIRKNLSVTLTNHTTIEDNLKVLDVTLTEVDPVEAWILLMNLKAQLEMNVAATAQSAELTKTTLNALMKS
ncbi:MAG: hypothetical protein ACK5TR_03480 [Alphaproteobacteria bacterium]|jgi:flagellin-like hook-associated protein FlgL|nr:hypothetical protein [Alphaproteobacteria bacterium]